MATKLIGYDDNLGLAKDFTEQTGYAIKPYHDLSILIDDFNRGRLDAIFIPAGTLPYISDYQLVAQSLFLTEKKTSLTTNFVTTENLSLDTIPKHTLGRVNCYCTTSFWAPLIYLTGKLPKGTHLNFVGTNGFLDMLLKTSKDEITASMVWDIFLQRNPQAADKTHVLFSKTGLPTPVIVSRETLPADDIIKIRQFTTADANAFFTAFQAPNQPAIDTFLRDVQKAIDYFGITIATSAVDQTKA